MNAVRRVTIERTGLGLCARWRWELDESGLMRQPWGLTWSKRSAIRAARRAVRRQERAERWRAEAETVSL